MIGNSNFGIRTEFLQMHHMTRSYPVSEILRYYLKIRKVEKINHFWIVTIHFYIFAILGQEKSFHFIGVFVMSQTLQRILSVFGKSHNFH